MSDTNSPLPSSGVWKYKSPLAAVGEGCGVLGLILEVFYADGTAFKKTNLVTVFEHACCPWIF